MTFLFQVLPDLPAPPPDIIAAVDLNLRPDVAKDIGRTQIRHLHNWYGRDFTAPRNIRVAYPAFESWVTATLGDRINDAGINYNCIDPGSGPISSGAHTDFTRSYALMWEIDPGGPESYLAYWRRRGQERLLWPPREQETDRDQLELVDRLRLPSNAWTLINGQVLHSAEYMMSTRIFLQISLINEQAVLSLKGMPPDIFKNQKNCKLIRVNTKY